MNAQPVGRHRLAQVTDGLAAWRPTLRHAADVAKTEGSVDAGLVDDALDSFDDALDVLRVATRRNGRTTP